MSVSKNLLFLSVLLLSSTALYGMHEDENTQNLSHAPSIDRDFDQSTKLSCAPYTASGAHFKSLLGKKYTHDSDENIRILLREKGEKFDEIENISLPLVKKILSTEADYRDFYVLYTGTSAKWGIFFDILTQIHNVRFSTNYEDTRIFRIFEDIIASDIKSFVSSQSAKVRSDQYIDYTHGYQTQALSTNLFLFGNHTTGYFSDTYGYFKGGRSQPTDFETFTALHNILKHFEIKEHEKFFEMFKNIYDKHYAAHPGRLFQIFIDPQVVSNTTYLSKSGGYPRAITSDYKQAETPAIVPISQAINIIRNNPLIIDRENTDTLQGRFFLKPDVMHNDQLIKVFSYHADGKSREHVTEEIATVVQEMFGMNSAIGPVEIAEKDVNNQEKNQRNYFFQKLKQDELSIETLDYFRKNPQLLEEVSLDPYDFKFKKWIDFSSYNAQILSIVKDMSEDQQSDFIKLLDSSFEPYQRPYIVQALKDTVSPQAYNEFLTILTEFNPTKMLMLKLPQLIRTLHALPSEDRTHLLAFLKDETNLKEMDTDEIFESVHIFKNVSQDDRYKLMNFAKKFMSKEKMEKMSILYLKDFMRKLTFINNTNIISLESLEKVIFSCQEKMINTYNVPMPDFLTTLEIIVNDSGRVTIEQWPERLQYRMDRFRGRF